MAPSSASSLTIFDYITNKYVVIRDKRLGVAYYVTAALIIIYTLAEIFLRKAYLEFDLSPQSSMRLIVADPNDRLCNITSSLSYCCLESTKKKRHCTYCHCLDSQSLSWPVESRIVTLATFAKERWQVTHTIEDNPHKYTKVREDMYFITNPEKVVVKLEHAVFASQFSNGLHVSPVAASHSSLHGELIDQQGQVVQSFPQTEKGLVDKLSLESLLDAAGVRSLDETSDALNAKGKSYRRHGIVLQVTISYSNTHNTWFGTGEIEYKYKVTRIPYADYRTNQIIELFKPEVLQSESIQSETMPRSRLLRKRYGVHIEFHQIGKLGQFSWSSFIIKLVSGMGLLTLTATLVDTVALYLMPNRNIYREYVYEMPSFQETHFKTN